MIFRKAKAVARLLKEMDYGVSLACRTTETGQSAVLRARRAKGHVYIERGFQIMDRKGAAEAMDLPEIPTIVDSSSMAVAKLVKLCMVPNEALDVLAEQIPSPRIISPAEQHAALQVARRGRQERREKEQAHLHRLSSWLADNCPDYDTLTKAEKERARKTACEALYSSQTPLAA